MIKVIKNKHDRWWENDDGDELADLLYPTPIRCAFSVVLELFNFAIFKFRFDPAVPWNITLCILGVYFYIGHGEKLSIHIYPYRPRLNFDFTIETFNFSLISIGKDEGCWWVALVFHLFFYPARIWREVAPTPQRVLYIWNGIRLSVAETLFRIAWTIRIWMGR